MKLKRNEIAAIKRVAATVQPILKKKTKVAKQIEDLNEQLRQFDDEIAVWEQGIRNLTGMGIEELVEMETVNGSTKFRIKEGILEEDDEAPQQVVDEIAGQTAEDVVQNDGNTIYQQF